MSRKNGNRNPAPTLPLKGYPPNGKEQERNLGEEKILGRMLRVELTEDEVRLLINVIQATPVQGNLQSLPPMITRLRGLQEKLGKAILFTTKEQRSTKE